MSATLYDILEINTDASFEEIARAKNRLAKLYHPDVNLKRGVDTTEKMQEILEAYALLSDPDKRLIYDRKLKNNQKSIEKRERVFRNFDLSGDEAGDDADFEEPEFVIQWKNVMKLYELAREAESILNKSNTGKFYSLGRAVRTFLWKIASLFHMRINRSDSVEKIDFIKNAIRRLIAELDRADVPDMCRLPYAMNWVMLRWSNSREQDYHFLMNKFAYSYFIQMPAKEKKELLKQKKHVEHIIKRIMDM